jgi:hypothetical protein
LISRSHAPDEDNDDAAEYECPACDFTGVLSGSSEMREGEVEWEYNDGVSEPVAPPVTVWLVCDAFRCFVCGFRLSGPEQLNAADLPIELELRQASVDDLSEYYSDYYADQY